MTYTVDYFIEKFDAIPDENWCVEQFVDTQGKKCALGHCGHKGRKVSLEGETLCRTIPCSIARINDGDYFYHELGDTPKERILNALLLVKVGLWKESLGG